MLHQILLERKGVKMSKKKKMYSGEVNIKSLALCVNRHDMPKCVTGAIFPRFIGDPTDIEGIRRQIAVSLHKVDVLNLFVTGLTVAVTEVVNYCTENEIKLVLWHYNPDTGRYYQQDMYAPSKKARINARFNNMNRVLEHMINNKTDGELEYCNIIGQTVVLDTITNIKFMNVNFIDCTFVGSASGIDMRYCKFTRCDGFANVTKSKFLSCDFRGFDKTARITFTHCDCTGTPIILNQYHDGITRVIECSGIKNMAALEKADVMLDVHDRK
jgi:hypothetical protein